MLDILFDLCVHPDGSCLLTCNAVGCAESIHCGLCQGNVSETKQSVQLQALWGTHSTRSHPIPTILIYLVKSVIQLISVSLFDPTIIFDTMTLVSRTVG